jgi:aryl-alcohol dehydrogenase-like predicted oxidoreductase
MHSRRDRRQLRSREHTAGKTVPQIALNWLLRKSTVSSIVIGARNEEQLKQNIGAEGWRLTPEQVAKLDEASAPPIPYP